MRLNQFIAHAGVCSRRKAEKLIQEGKITVNGHVVKQLSCIIGSGDVVQYEQQVLTPTKQVYILLNKPFNSLSTLHDPQGRRSVLDCIGDLAKKLRIYPIGRLDRNTTGVLLLTNDGNLARKLSHPSTSIAKVYEVTLQQPLQSADLDKIRLGVVLEDGIAGVDKITCTDGSKRRVRIQLHSGKNRILRRLFAHLGYRLLALSRLEFAGLHAGNLGLGQWRFLTDQETQALQAM